MPHAAVIDRRVKINEAGRGNLSGFLVFMGLDDLTDSGGLPLLPVRHAEVQLNGESFLTHDGRREGVPLMLFGQNCRRSSLGVAPATPMAIIPKMQQDLRFALTFGFAVICLGTDVRGQAEADGPDFLKNLFDAATLYENKENPYLQKLSFTGRAQFDYVATDGEGMRTGDLTTQDLQRDVLQTRRLRTGIKAAFLQNFTLAVEVDFKPEEAPIYNRLTDVYIGYKYSDAFGVKVGKQSMSFTLDGSTSSRELLTLERNNLANNLWFTSAFLPGVTFSGKLGNWVYNTGVFSQGDLNKEFGQFNTGATFLATAGYDFSTCLGSEEALLTLNYVYNEPTISGDPLFTNRALENVGSLNFRYLKDDIGLQTDLSVAQGYGSQPDVWGFVVMPYYNFTGKLQGVLRYTLVDSNGDNGVRYGGYESDLLIVAKGDLYQEVYAGLNYYFYGQKLKVQTGLAYIDMEDAAHDGGEFSGLSFQTGLRIYW